MPNEPLELFPLASAAVQLTVVVPTGNTLPDGGVQPTVGLASKSSVAVAAYETTAPVGPVATTDIAPGRLKTGGVESANS